MVKAFFGLLIFLIVVSFTPCLRGEDDLLNSTGFNDFCVKWIGLLNEKGCYSRDHVCVRKDEKDPGVIIAEYRKIGKILEKRVKKTTNEKVPYVGILKYYVVIYKSKGKSADEAIKGPFQKGEASITTEIFYYKDGKWIY